MFKPDFSIFQHQNPNFMEFMRTMKLLLLCCTLLFFVAPLSTRSDDGSTFSQIRIFVSDKAALSKVWESGIDFEGSSGKVGSWMEFVAGSEEKDALTRLGVSYSIVVDDLSKAAMAGLAKEPMDALGFGYGSMGGYYTLSEVEAQLDSMRLLYPSLITAKTPIGLSVQSRFIWGVKISDNADTEESEPEALYTALHHAREPQGMMTVVYYMWWLLEQYGNDERATYLVNNRQLWFVPVVNPDGYAYNQSTNPNGGGFWRKNRRNNGDGTSGVDLNRNYGPEYMWNAANGGSSLSTSSDTYRGTEPFSEPEVGAISGFVSQHPIKACLNYHTYGNYLIFPWGYLSRESGDSSIYREFGYDMVSTNRYNSGTDQQTVSYSTRGNSDDFMYGDPSKQKIFAMTPEVGSSFWPSSSLIFPLAIENLNANLYLSYIAGQYSVLDSYEIVNDQNEEVVERGDDVVLRLKLKNKGLSDAGELRISVTSSSAIVWSNPSDTIPSLLSRDTAIIIFTGHISSTATTGVAEEAYITITNQNGYTRTDTATFFLGAPTVLFSDDAEYGTGAWLSGTSWDLSAYSHSGAFSFGDSPSGNYSSNSENILELTEAIDLSEYDAATLEFWTKWAIEPTWDFGMVEISTDGGDLWISQRTTLSHPGSGKGKQSIGVWGYDGYVPGLDWVRQSVDLTPYAGSTLYLRFRLTSDGSDQRDGWFIDDIVIKGYQLNEVTFGAAITVGNFGNSETELHFGEAASATGQIDSVFGEEELEPVGSENDFDARWMIEGTNGTLRNMQPVLIEDSLINEYRFSFQAGSGGYPIRIGWNPRNLGDGGWHLIDDSTGGSIVRVDMWRDTLLVVSETDPRRFTIIHATRDSLRMHVGRSWNIISLPLTASDSSPETIFPGASSPPFEFSGSYTQSGALEKGKGYWMKFPERDTILVTGTPTIDDTVEVPSGWQLLGSIGCEIPATSVSPAFRYDGSYSLVDSVIFPGEGFWIKGPRTLTLSCFTPPSPTKPDLLLSLDGLSSITIRDAAGHQAVMYFDTKPWTFATGLELPPLPPAGSFDARFSSNFIGHVFDHASPVARIDIQGATSPLLLSWNITSSAISGLTISPSAGPSSRIVGPTGSTTINSRETESIRLSVIPAGDVPSEFTLEQNFPNPFNPNSSIGFSVPVKSVVSLRLFNMLGEEVMQILGNQEYEAGRYTTMIDGSAIPSGTYFYTLVASTVDASRSATLTRKLLLIR